jgi:hypothetical protein
MQAIKQRSKLAEIALKTGIEFDPETGHVISSFITKHGKLKLKELGYHLRAENEQLKLYKGGRK